MSKSRHMLDAGLNLRATARTVRTRLRAWLALPGLWHRRAQGRHELAQLTPEQLADVGLNPQMIARICAKPFWEA